MISVEQAIEAARRAAIERGWPWEGRIDVSRVRAFIFFGRLTYEVRSNADMLGTNVRVVVDPEDGTVREAYWLPR
jgi:hypothetical protein